MFCYADYSLLVLFANILIIFLQILLALELINILFISLFKTFSNHELLSLSFESLTNLQTKK